MWLKSRRGRWYLAEVRRGESGRRYYRGDDLHPRDCAERVAAELVSLRREEKRARIGAELAELAGRVADAAGRGDVAERDRLIAEMERLTALLG